MEQKGFVFLLRDPANNYLISSAPTRGVKREIERLEMSYDVHLLVEWMIPTDDRVQLQNELVSKYDGKRRQYGWFELGAADVKYIQSLSRVDYQGEEVV